MATNTSYNPQNIKDFEKSKLLFNGQSIYFECTPNSENYADLLITDDVLITGGILMVKGADFHDQVYLQIVHPDYGVVNEFVSGFRMLPDSIKQFDINLNYPAKIPAGYSIRCKYVAINSLIERDIALNFHLHKVLE